MPFDAAILGQDWMPMNHKTVQPVGARALRCFDETGTEIPGWHHIVRGDNGGTIRIAPDSYAVVQNQLAIETIEAALECSRLDLTDARFGVDYSHDGARMFAQWLLPAHTETIRPGVEASLRVVMMNSYDGSTSLWGRVGSFNWACANQAVSGKEMASFKFRHTGQIDLTPAVARLTTAAEEHTVQAKLWKTWPAIPVTDQQVRAVLVSLPDASKSQVDGLVHNWLKARDDDPVQGGANLWALFNVLTAWASEKGDNVTNRAQRNADREARVAKVVDGKLWAELAA